MATFRQMLVVHPSLSVNSLAEFVALAKKQPVNYGSGGVMGTPGHLTMESLRLKAGFQATNLPYRGAPQVTADLLAGQFPVGFLATPAVLPHVRTGKLKTLGISSPQRLSAASLPGGDRADQGSMQDNRLDAIERPERHPAVDRLTDCSRQSSASYRGGELPGRKVDGRR